MKIFILSVAISLTLGTMSFPNDDNSFREEWKTFKKTYGKGYKTADEEELRRRIFTENLHFIEHHNEKYEQNLVTYTLGINKYADLKYQEFINIRGLNNLEIPCARNEFIAVPYIPRAVDNLPDFVDWRKEDAVTNVDDEEGCLSDYAFSAIGAAEAQLRLKEGKLLKLSAQNIIDCTRKSGNSGCMGGWIRNSYIHMKERGILLDKYYPYEAKEGECRDDPSKSDKLITINFYYKIKMGRENDVKIAVAMKGPVAALVDAKHESFRLYSGGLYHEPECSETNLNHALLIVGYGNNGSGDYWLAKNSWGTDWGEDGYIYMSRNKNNQCGIATNATIPNLYH